MLSAGRQLQQQLGRELLLRSQHIARFPSAFYIGAENERNEAITRDKRD